MCAQTLVYGMLTSRITDPQAFGASPTLSSVPLSNPFLAAFFEQVHDQVAEIENSEESGLEQLIADLRESNVEAILDQFGATAGGADPVIHFYENFLARYDNEARVESGAFYTPQPVVRFMVRAVDEILKERFGLLEGVADTGTWAEVAARNQFDVPTSVDPNERFVSMIDPATGTGTFLVEWIKQARESFLAVHPAEEWPARLAGEILPAMHGFELMLAPYSIAHLKIVLEAQLDDGQLPDSTVALTDTLERITAAPSFDDLEDPLAAEGQRAEALKSDAHFTVAIGNPPYMRTAKDAGGGWVVHGNGTAPALFEDVVKVASARGAFSYVASLYNLYTYFWRWAIWKVFEQYDRSPGVIAFITASSWLDGPGFVGLRELAARHSSEIWVVDLGGDSHAAVQEQNVFDIQTPVSICLLVQDGRTSAIPSGVVRYRKIDGDRSEKLARLEADRLGIDGADWQDVGESAMARFTPGQADDSWLAMPALADLFPWRQPGCKLNRNWVVAPDPSFLEERWNAFLSDPDPVRRAELFPDPRSGRAVTTRVGDLPRLADLPSDSGHQAIVPYYRRAFDRQWTFRDPRLAGLERPSLWQSVSEAQLFMIVKSGDGLGAGPTALVTSLVPDMDAFRGSYGGKDVVPLFREDNEAAPNVTSNLLDALGGSLGVSVSPRDLFAYCYSLLSNPSYQSRFAAELAAGEVRVPLSADPKLWADGVDLGLSLIDSQTRADRQQTSAPGEELRRGLSRARWALLPTKMPESAEAIEFDFSAQTLRVGDGLIEGVSVAAWEHAVSGWPVVRRWFEHRTVSGRGTKSSELDDLRPRIWFENWNSEALVVLDEVEFAVSVMRAQDELLDQVVMGKQITPAELPVPTLDQQLPPASLPFEPQRGPGF
jgi:predicted helicase